MPDKNGEKTLRDIYPIYCQMCGRMIQPAIYNDYSTCIVEAEDYRVTGLQLDSDAIPKSLYAHLACLGIRGVEIQPKIQADGYHCLYCGKPSDEDYCCLECANNNRRDMEQRQPSDAVRELFSKLAALRATQTEQNQVGQNSNGHTPGATGSHGTRTKAPPPVPVLIDDPDRLGPFIPQNEMGVIFMFGQVIGRLKYRMAYMDGRYPDAILVSPEKQLLKVEFEFTSSNFLLHRHDPDLCDLVICWEQNCNLRLPTLSLAKYYDATTGGWNFSELA